MTDQNLQQNASQHAREKVLSIVNQMISNGDMVDTHESDHNKQDEISRAPATTRPPVGQSSEHPPSDESKNGLTTSKPMSQNTPYKTETDSHYINPKAKHNTNDVGATRKKHKERPETTSARALNRQELNQIRVKMLRALTRIGNSPGNIRQQALSRLDAYEQAVIPTIKQNHSDPSDNLSGNNSTKLAQEEAERLENYNGDETVQKITVLCLGIIGSGKTSTINNIIQRATPIQTRSNMPSDIGIVTAKVLGVQYTFIDTPGLYPSFYQKNYNEKILRKIKRTISKFKPDINLYFDRMDYARRGKADSCVLKSISEILGKSSLSNIIVILTHAGTSLPRAAFGQLGFEKLCEQRQSMIEKLIKESSEGSREDTRRKIMYYPVENNPICWDPISKEHHLPNKSPWRPSLLSLVVVYKAFREANELFGNPRARAKNVDLLSMLRAQSPGKEISDMLQQIMSQLQTQENSEFDMNGERILSELEINMLEEENARKDALNSREKYISQKTEERRSARNGRCPEVAAPATEHRARFLPLTFDPVNNTIHRYRYIENRSGWKILPILANMSLDHDDGINGVVIVNEELALRKPGELVGGLPMYVRAEIEKDKLNKNFKIMTYFTIGKNILPLLASRLEKTHLDAFLSCEHRSDQSYTKESSYVARLECVTDSFLMPQNKTIIGLLMSSEHPIKRGVPWTCGAKLEDRISFGEEGEVSISLGTCQHKSPGGSTQEAKSLITKIVKKVNKNCTLSAHASVNWFRRDRRTMFSLEHQQSITQGTLINSVLNYDFRGRKTVFLRVTSSDRTGIAYLFFAPVINMLFNIRKREEFF